MIVVSHKGNQLIEIVGVDTALDPAIPVTFTQTIVERDRHTLLIFNAERNQWEIPGGGLEPGETLDDCAARELWEEASQVVVSLERIGFLRIKLVTRGGVEVYGAIYGASIGAVQPFVPSAECSRMMLWDGIAPLDGELGAFSRAMLAWYAGRLGG
ncbi:MAG: NUDIX domain-containing protein [Chloroflexi bacterium]|nr:NUDIX domain-containing protein [Chloroflexota bacterium]